jgi:hypothetical protein
VQAERVFPGAARVRVSFRLNGRELPADGSFEIEVQSQRHHRPVRLRITRGGLACEGEAHRLPPIPFELKRWYVLTLNCDGVAGRFTLSVDGTPVYVAVPFAEPAPVMQRIVFRTGPWRGRVPSHLVDGSPKSVELEPGDLPGADLRAPPIVFWVAGLATQPA